MVRGCLLITGCHGQRSAAKSAVLRRAAQGHGTPNVSSRLHSMLVPHTLARVQPPWIIRAVKITPRNISSHERTIHTAVSPASSTTATI